MAAEVTSSPELSKSAVKVCSYMTENISFSPKSRNEEEDLVEKAIQKALKISVQNDRMHYCPYCDFQDTTLENFHEHTREKHSTFHIPHKEHQALQDNTCPSEEGWKRVSNGAKARKVHNTHIDCNYNGFFSVLSCDGNCDLNVQCDTCNRCTDQDSINQSHAKISKKRKSKVKILKRKALVNDTISTLEEFVQEETSETKKRTGECEKPFILTP